MCGGDTADVNSTAFENYADRKPHPVVPEPSTYGAGLLIICVKALWFVSSFLLVLAMVIEDKIGPLDE